MFGDEDRLRSCRAQIALLILLVVAVSAVCSRSLWNGFARDDLSMIVHNHLIEKWSTFFSRVSSGRQFFFRPVFGLWLRLNFEIVGRNAIGWHALKILVHLVAVLLVFDIARLLSGSVGVAMLTALFFGLLPAHDDAVAWVGSPEPLAAALELGAFSLVVRSARSGKSISFGALALFAASAFTFEGAIVFPLLVLLYLLLLDGEGSDSIKHPFSPRRLARATIACIPFLLVAGLYLWVRLGTLTTRGLSDVGIDRALFGPYLFQHSLWQVLSTIPAVFLAHLSVAVLPWASGPAHPVNWVTSFASVAFLRPLALLALGTSAFIVVIWHMPRRNLYLFAALWFLICLAPMFNFDNVEDLVEDRWTYLSSFGWCLILADALILVGQARALRAPAAALATALAVVYGIALWRAEYYWRSDGIFLARAVEMDPDSPELREALARQLEVDGDWKGAEVALQALVRLRPDNRRYHFFLAVAEQRLGRGAGAVAEMRESLPACKDRQYSDQQSDLGSTPACRK